MPRHRVLLAMEAQYFRGGRPRRILCLSRQEVDALVHYYDVDPTVTTVVPNPFDPQQFNPERRTRDREAARAAMGIGEDEMAVLFIANELHRKGFGPLLGALSLSGEQRMAVHMVGKADIGPYRTMIHRLGLDGRVHVAGPSADVGWHLAAADLMVLPTQYEPFGLVIIEALASGVPVITSRLAGASEAIDHGSTGLILEDPYDVEELAALLVQAAAADLESWGRRAAASVDAYRRDRVMPRVESVIFP
jgi:UDP-glucose:(heptosyl)LPS alpha-1,3-glucosyltransferase